MASWHAAHGVWGAEPAWPPVVLLCDFCGFVVSVLFPSSGVWLPGLPAKKTKCKKEEEEVVIDGNKNKIHTYYREREGQI
jgi:hypothetical protein